MRPTGRCAGANDQWRPVPGFGGMYEISDMGAVRSWRWRGSRKVKSPHLLTAFVRKRGANGRGLFVKLTDESGTGRDVSLMGLMVDVWLGGKRPGLVPYHKNGDLADNWVGNIAFASRRELGKRTGASAARIPVAKVTPEGEIVEVYPSARAAARENHMSYQTVLDRCNGKVKKPFALDGHTYQFER